MSKFTDSIGKFLVWAKEKNKSKINYLRNMSFPDKQNSKKKDDEKYELFKEIDWGVNFRLAYLGLLLASIVGAIELLPQISRPTTWCEIFVPKNVLYFLLVFSVVWSFNMITVHHLDIANWTLKLERDYGTRYIKYNPTFIRDVLFCYDEDKKEYKRQVWVIVMILVSIIMFSMFLFLERIEFPILKYLQNIL